MAMTQQQIADGLKQLTAQSAKIAGEQSARFDTLTARIKELSDALDNGNATAEVETAFTNLQTAQQALDDVIPDAPPVA